MTRQGFGNGNVRRASYVPRTARAEPVQMVYAARPSHSSPPLSNSFASVTPVVTGQMLQAPTPLSSESMKLCALGDEDVVLLFEHRVEKPRKGLWAINLPQINGMMQAQDEKKGLGYARALVSANPEIHLRNLRGPTNASQVGAYSQLMGSEVEYVKLEMNTCTGQVFGEFKGPKVKKGNFLLKGFRVAVKVGVPILGFAAAGPGGAMAGGYATSLL